MKKILVVSEVFWPENFMINDLVHQLKERGYTVDILTQHPSYPVSKVFDGYENCDYRCEEWDGSKIFRFKVVEGYRDSKVKKILNYIHFVSKGSKIAKQLPNDYDLVLVSQTGPLSVAAPAIAYAQKNRCPLLLWVLDIWPDAVYAYVFKKNIVLSTLLNRFITWVYSKSDTIFVSSKNFSDSVKRYAQDKEILYMPNWLVESKDIKSNITLDQSLFNITFAGNISLYQNLSNVIEGFRRANLEGVILNIVGDGSMLSELKRVVEHDNIQGVIFHGRVSPLEVHDILTQSDALLLPLIADEGIQKTEPLKIQSYLKSGKPIFGVIYGSGRDIIEQNGLGICADPDNIEDIASKFKALTELSEEQRHKAAENSTSLLKSRFNRESIFRRFCEVIER